MNNISEDILRTLVYFDYFNYPLSREDIFSFARYPHGQTQVDEALNKLVKDKIVFRLQEFYSLQNNLKIAERRKRGNQLAEKQLTIARKVARLLGHFPFVEAVAVSGSLSKYYADEKTDIDYFIITKANRLWIARTLMHLFKKLTYIKGNQHLFCMNYYVDEPGMEITEKNIFTAMEIVTLLPMSGLKCFRKFMKANHWTTDLFPMRHTTFDAETEIKKSFICKCFEKIFNSRAGDLIDKWLMTVTDKRWKEKTKRAKLNARKPIGMVVGRHFSKPDPENFQMKVVHQYETRVEDLLGSLQPASVHL